MACNAAKFPFIRVISARGFASAQPSPACTPKSQPSLCSTILPNKVFVASLDNGAPVARVTVAYKAGSRYEPPEELGLSHFVRTAAGISTSGATAFGIMRNIQQYGGNLTSSADRETISYTLEASKDNLEKIIQFLTDVASKQVFRPWEFEKVIERMAYETGGLSPQVRAMDLLHKAAFRRGLGNSLFCSPRQANKISSESLQHFFCQNFVAERCSVAVAGLPLDRAVAIAQTLCMTQGSNAPSVPSCYRGGDLRKEIGGELAHIAIAGHGGALSNAKESLAFAILARAISSGQQVKWGNDNSPLGKAIAQQLCGVPFAANGFSTSYTDAGLIGVILTTTKDNAGKAAQAASQVLKKSSSVGKDAIARGRNQLITEVLCLGDSSLRMAEDMAIQGVLTGCVVKPSDLAATISSISDSDVMSAAGKISQSRLSMGAVGNLAYVPYIDEMQ